MFGYNTRGPRGLLPSQAGLDDALVSDNIVY